MDEALTAQRASRLLLTAYPDDRQREHALRWLGWIARHLGDGDRLTLQAVSSWVPKSWLRGARWLVAVVVLFVSASLGYVIVPRWPVTVIPLALGVWLFLTVRLPRMNRSAKLAELALLMQWRERVRLRRLLAEAVEHGIMRRTRSGYQFADPSSPPGTRRIWPNGHAGTPHWRRGLARVQR